MYILQQAWSFKLIDFNFEPSACDWHAPGFLKSVYFGYMYVCVVSTP